MFTRYLWGVLCGASLALISCQAEKTREVGEVGECTNGTYYDLGSERCEVLAGHTFLRDPSGYEWVANENGLTVPRVIDGRSPFFISFQYDVTRPTAFDVVVKKVEYGQFLDDNLTNWEKVRVEPGRGVKRVRLTPKDNGSISKGPSAQYLDGLWQRNTGYIVEVKGGDRFEDEDADSLRSWRVAGIEVDPSVGYQPEAQYVAIGDIQFQDKIMSCQGIRGVLPIYHTDKPLEIEIAIKEPGNEWRAWSSSWNLKVPSTFKGEMLVLLDLKDKDGACPPEGEPMQTEPWKQEKGKYVLQMDVYAVNEVDKTREKLSLPSMGYQGKNAVGIRVLPPPPAAVTEAPTEEPSVSETACPSPSQVPQAVQSASSTATSCPAEPPLAAESTEGNMSR